MIPPPIPSRPDSSPAATPTTASRRVTRAARSPSSSSATRRSCGVVTLKFSGVDSTTRTVPPLRSTSQASSVACGEHGVVDVERALERLAPERLRRLDRPQPRAVERRGDAAVLAGLLDRVGHRRGRDRRVGVLERGERVAEVRGRHERARGVVDDDVRVGARGPQRAAHRRRARRAAGHADAAGRRRAARRQGDDDLLDPRRPQRHRRSTRASGGPPGRRTPWAGRRQGVRHCLRPPGGRPPTSYDAGQLLLAGALEEVVEVLLGLLLAHLERVHQLGREDLLRAGEHLLLTRGETLVLLADREVAHDLGELVDVTGLDLVPVVLEAAVPVLRHLRDVVGEHGEDLLDRLLVDHAAQAGLAGVLTRDHDGHVVVKNLDRQVLALLPEDVLLFLLDDLPGTVMRVHDVVANGEVDALDLTADVEVLDLVGIGDDVLLGSGRPRAGPPAFVSRSAGNGPRD